MDEVRSRAHEAERNVIELETPLKVLNAKLLTEVHHLVVKLRDAESALLGRTAKEAKESGDSCATTLRGLHCTKCPFPPTTAQRHVRSGCASWRHTPTNRFRSVLLYGRRDATASEVLMDGTIHAVKCSIVE